MSNTVVMSKKSNINQDSKNKRAISTQRKCVKAQEVTSSFRREATFSARSPTSKSPACKNLFKVPDSKTLVKVASKKCINHCSTTSAILSPARKSISLSDLSPVSKDKEFSYEDMSQNCSTDVKDQTSRSINEHNINLRNQKIQNAGRIISNMLIINAWRRRKDEVAQLNVVIDNLKQQVNNLILQIAVLRKLIEREDPRIGKLTSDVQQIKSEYDEKSQECENLKKENELLEKKVQDLNEKYEDRLVSEKNVMNNLDTANKQLESMETQILRDREKILKLKEDKKLLLEKVSNSEKAAAENNKKIRDSQNTIEDLQMKLAAQLSLVTFAEKEKDEFKQKLEDALNEQVSLRQQLKCHVEKEKKYLLEATKLGNKANDLDKALRRIEAEYDLLLSKINDSRDHAKQFGSNYWTNRVLEIAGSFVRTPQTIFRSLPFF